MKPSQKDSHAGLRNFVISEVQHLHDFQQGSTHEALGALASLHGNSEYSHSYLDSRIDLPQIDLSKSTGAPSACPGKKQGAKCV